MISMSESLSTSLLNGHSEREPPDPIPNSEVKTFCANDSDLRGRESRSPLSIFILETPVSFFAYGGFLFLLSLKKQAPISMYPVS
jgi:hypothetical protein